MKRILLLDDCADDHSSLVLLLRNKGFEVETARNGWDALSIARERRPDAVVSALVSPETGAFSLLSRLRADARFDDVPFLFCPWARPDAEDHFVAMALGADAVLSGPAELEGLSGLLMTSGRRAWHGMAVPPASTDVAPSDGDRTSMLIRRLERKTVELESANRQLLVQITERNRAAAVRNGVLNALDAEIALLDVSGVIVAANEPWARCATETPLRRPGMRVGTNYLAACQMGATDGDANAARAVEAILNVLTGVSEKVTFEYPAHRIDGHGWFRLAVSPLAEGTTGFVVSHVDVTGARVAELRRQAADLRLALAVETASIGVWQWDFARSESIWDERMYGIYGVEVGSRITFERWLAAVHPEDRERMRGPTKISPDVTLHRSFRIVRPDGTVRHLFVTERITDTGGEERSHVGMTWDVTEFREAQETKIEIQQRFETLVNEATIGVLVHIDFRPVMANDQLAQIFGHRDRHQILMLDDCSALITPRDHDRSHNSDARRFPGQRAPGYYAATGLRADGREVALEIRSFPISWGNDRAVCVLVTDVTEQRAIEARLRQSQNLEAIGQLTGGVAHDFNNLLTVILGNSDLLGSELAHEPRLAGIARQIQHAAERGAALTSQLLTVGRQQALDLRTVDLNHVLTDMRDLLQRTLGAHIEVSLDLEDRLPSIRVDQGLLENATLNLCLNARDAMPDGGRLSIATRTVLIEDDSDLEWDDAVPGLYVVAEITDTGCGMDAQTIERAMEPFFTTKEAGRGTGLGLSTVYGFARQSGGYLRLWSVPDLGTVASLYFRADSATAEAREPASEVLPAGTGSVLVVEDDPIVREHVVGMLAQFGYETACAANAAEALEILAGGSRFDLMFSDVVMPGAMNGVELARHVASRWPRMAVLLTSGYADTALVAGQGDAVPFDIVWKPYCRSELARKASLAIDVVRQKVESEIFY